MRFPFWRRCRHHEANAHHVCDLRRPGCDRNCGRIRIRNLAHVSSLAVDPSRRFHSRAIRAKLPAANPGRNAAMRTFAICAVALACLAASPVLALSEKPYLAATDADFGNLLPPPPADGSAADKRDMKQLLDMQKAATPAQLAKAEADVEVSVYRLAGEIFGPTFTKERFPLAGAFFAKVNTDSAVGVRPIKAQYHRKRPFHA